MAHGNEINNKKYYWLKLDRHFFGNARIKKLRKLAGGDTYTIIYLKLLLLSIEFGGVLVFEGIEDTFEKEMALKLEEDEENVIVTINYLKIQGLLLENGEDGFLPEAASSIGSETKSNVYKRNRSLVVGNIPTTIQPTSNHIPIEGDIEEERDLDIDSKKEKEGVSAEGGATLTAPKRFKKPTLEEVQSYCRDRQNDVDAQRFIDYYSSNGWKVGKNPMKDWKAAVRTWEKTEKKKPKQYESSFDADEFFNAAVKKGLGGN